MNNSIDKNEVNDEVYSNAKNKVEYDRILENVKTDHSNYYDINKPHIKIILGILFGVGIVGLIYYVVMWFLSN